MGSKTKIMARLTITQKKDALTNFLRTVSKNEKLIIQTSDSRLGNRFAIAEKGEGGTVSPKSNFMLYEEMNCYLFGVLAVQENRVKF
jgi:hypothetical protein